MDIIINEPLSSNERKLYQGERWRYPTMTDVKFLSTNMIVAAHRHGCKVYLISLEDTVYVIKDRLTLMYNNKPYPTESFVVLGNTIYMISFSDIMTIIDILPGNRLRQRQTYVKLEDQVPFHGIASRNGLVYITPSKQQIGTQYIHEYNPASGKLSKIISLGDTIRVKGLAFLSNDLVVVVLNYKVETSMVQTGHTFDGVIKLYTLDFTLLDSVEVPLTHFDAIVSQGSLFYATGADLQGGYIFKGCVDGQKFKSITAHSVHDFPHGIDIMDSKIAYTSYHTSGVHIVNEDVLEESASKPIFAL